MQERAACAVLKAHFEAAGFRISENRTFEEGGLRFEMDGFDPERRVGYEYVTTEAGDGWDVDDTVIAELAARKDRGELFVLVVDEAEAPDEATLRAKATAFIARLPAPEAVPPADQRTTRAAKPPPMPNSAANKPPPMPKSAAKKPAAKKPATKSAKKPAAKKPPKKR